MGTAWSLTSSSVSAYLAVVSFPVLLFSISALPRYCIFVFSWLSRETGFVLEVVQFLFFRFLLLWLTGDVSGIFVRTPAELHFFWDGLAGCSDQWTVHVIAHFDILKFTPSPSSRSFLGCSVSPSVITWTTCPSSKPSAWSSGITRLISRSMPASRVRLSGPTFSGCSSRVWSRHLSLSAHLSLATMDKLLDDYTHFTAKTCDEFDFVSGCVVHKTHEDVSTRIVVESWRGEELVLHIMAERGVSFFCVSCPVAEFVYWGCGIWLPGASGQYCYNAELTDGCAESERGGRKLA